MARDKSAWDRFREREEERLKEEAARAKKDSAMPGSKGNTGGGLYGSGAKEVTETGIGTPDQQTLAIVAKCEVLIEQITNLYHMYVQGMERIPPITQRKHLEDLILKIQAGPKAMRATQFQCSQFMAKYSMYKEKWDRLVRDIEAGKVAVRRRGA